MELTYIENSTITALKELTEKEYNYYKNLIENINKFRAIYSALDNVTSNLQNILNFIDDYASKKIKPIEFHADIRSKIENFLSAVRSYVDTFEHTLSGYYGKESEILKIFREEKSKYFDKVESYRFVEELRNFTQHRAFPDCSIESNSVNGQTKINIFINKQCLLEDKKFRSNRIPVKDAKTDKIDVINHFVIMLGCLASINDRICDIASESTMFAEFFAVKNQYKQYMSGLCLTTLVPISDNNIKMNIIPFEFLIIDCIVKMNNQKNEYIRNIL